MIIDEERFDLDGHELVLRFPNDDEAQVVLDVFKKVNEETDFLIKEVHEITFNENSERKLLNLFMLKERDFFIGAYYDGKYVGNASFTTQSELRLRHRGEIGIAILQEYTHLGIGTKLLEKVFRDAAKVRIEQIELEVMSKNIPAINLYKKLGFIQCGIKPRSMKYKDGTYDDAYIMIKYL